MRKSKRVGSIRKEQLGRHKHETVLAIRGEKPPSVVFMVIGIGYRLAYVERSKIPNPYRFVVRTGDKLFAIWRKCDRCEDMCMALQHLQLVARRRIPDPH